jgi:beta-galactosidase
MEFEHLKYPPFVLETKKIDRRKLKFPWGDLRIDGYVKGEKVISKSLSGLGADQKFMLLPDDRMLAADGADTTRVVMRVTDEFGALRTYANDPIVFTLEGHAELIGDNPFSLIGGTGAVWIRAGEVAGVARLTAKHPRLGSQTVEITLSAAAAEGI